MYILKLLIITMFFSVNAYAAYYIDDMPVFHKPSFYILVMAIVSLAIAISMLLSLCFFNTKLILKVNKRKLIYNNLIYFPLVEFFYFFGYYLILSNVTKHNSIELSDLSVFDKMQMLKEMHIDKFPEGLLDYEFYKNILLVHYTLSLLCALVAKQNKKVEH